MPKRKCAYCNEFFERDEMIVDRLSSFCTQEHRLLSVKTGHERLVERRRKQKQETDIPQDVRDLVLKLDNYRCRYCGSASANLVAHHIVYRSEARNEPWLNDPVNLITLCNYPCHIDIVHSNKSLYQPLCRQVVYLRSLKGDSMTTIEELERSWSEYNSDT